MIRISIAISTVLALLAAPAALADDQAKADAATIDKGFAEMDTDKNGSISRAEFETFTRGYLAKKRSDFDAEFSSLDVNKDGRLDKTEADANAALGVYFEQLDFNSDGYLGKDEMTAALKAAQEAKSGG